MVCILLTGMSGTGKSALVGEFRGRGYQAYDADDDGFSEPRPNGGWGWRIDLVQALLAGGEDDLLFFAGCSEEQALFDFDLKVLLTAPGPMIIERLQTRRSNSYGKNAGELKRVFADLQQVEPILRNTADLIVDTTMPVSDVADLVLGRVAALPKRRSE